MRLPLNKLPPLDGNTRANFTDSEWAELVKQWKKEAPELFEAANKVRDIFGEGTRITYVGPIRGKGQAS